MQRRGRRRVLERYTWERTARGYLTEFSRILERGETGNAGFAESEDTDQAWLKKLYYDTEESK